MKKIIDLRKRAAPIPEVYPTNRQASPSSQEKSFVIRYPKFPYAQISPSTHYISSPYPSSLSWSGPIFRHDPDMKAIWFASGFIFAAAVLFQIFQKNLITTVFLGLLGLMLILHAKKKPKPGQVDINPTGIKINEQIYSYKDLKSFWVDYQPDYEIRELSLRLKKWYLPYLKIQIGNQDPVRLRSFLIQFIPEVEHEGTLADAIGRRLGL